MRIKSVRLRDYKRFTDLTITDLPNRARLVVLVGPNGAGKSSVFDSFLLKAKAAFGNYAIVGNLEMEEYYDKLSESQTTQDIANRVDIELHGINASDVNWKSAFHVRSAYRNEADFRLTQLQAPPRDEHQPRLGRIIDPDLSVSANYGRMVWKRLEDLDRNAPGHFTFEHYRRESLGDLQNAMRLLFSDPVLLLQDFGGIQGGSFRFGKGRSDDFHYKNLSGGEKAVFDVLLDVFLRRDSHEGAVFCIDEPELHVATALQGQLIASVLDLLRGRSQLWVATHSIGIVRKAYRMWQDQSEHVVFLDFSGHDFDSPVTIAPSAPGKKFWANMYQVLLDDLATLVAPQRVFICEGNKRQHRAFDANCYNRLFAKYAPETLFVSQGGAREVVQSEHLVTIVQAIASGIEVVKVIDRDDMTDEERAKKIHEGIRVLRRREIEDYLYDPAVLRTFLGEVGCDPAEVDRILIGRKELLGRQGGPQNVKKVSRDLLEMIRRVTGLGNLGNNREQFALQFLVPALQETSEVFEELREDVFGDAAASEST